MSKEINIKLNKRKSQINSLMKRSPRISNNQFIWQYVIEADFKTKDRKGRNKIETMITASKSMKKPSKKEKQRNLEAMYSRFLKRVSYTTGNNYEDEEEGINQINKGNITNIRLFQKVYIEIKNKR